MLFWCFLSGVVFAGSLWLFLKLRTWGFALQKFEFENRNSAGVLEFESFEASRAHARRKNYLGFCALPVVIVLALSGIALLLTTIDYLSPNTFRFRCNSAISCERLQ